MTNIWSTRPKKHRDTATSLTDDLKARHFGGTGGSLADVGESKLVDALVKEARRSRDGHQLGVFLVDAGDDAAVWQPPPGRAVVLTQDALVEGIDYLPSWLTPYQLGRRAVTVSLSDIAGMAGTPIWCTITFCASPTTLFDDLLAIQHGACEIAREVGCAVVGGDISQIDGPLVVDVSAGGIVDANRMLRRNTGRIGDVLIVTGKLGRAAAGLRILSGHTAAPLAADVGIWIEAQIAPEPRLAEAAMLARNDVTCGGDVSDGLIIDAGRTARASGCAAELWLDAIPVDDLLRESFDDWPSLALGGGEDFEILAAVSKHALHGLLARWPSTLAPLSAVGRLVPGAGVRLLQRKGGRTLALPPIQSQHFSESS